MTANVKAVSQPAGERRIYERVATALTGKFFVPAEEITLDCEIVNLSAGGAGVRSAEPPPLNTYVVLYIDGFGRFECVATRFVDGLLGLHFVCKEAKRQRLLRDLALYVASGAAGVTRLRRHPRNASASVGYFKRPNGELVRCDVLDISLQGVSLRTASRPPMGEIINLGRTWGRIVRHHEEGIAIQFLELASPDPEHGG
ncbi:MAG TPA: PilZ domain-containing protein [Rhizomicrobium sp.]|nr:PilZ domain-containing protein [Rhizomicrobium sp.]